MTALKWFKSRKGQQTLIILAFMIIPLALLFIFTYLPFGEMVKFSFYKMKYTTPVDKRVFVGLKNYEGSKVFKIGSIVKLVKEPDNDFDLEAIACEMKYIGKVGYIANSTRTVTKGTMSAGRIYDKIDDISFCEVKFISTDSVIAKVLNNDKIKQLQEENPNDDYYNSHE